MGHAVSTLRSLFRRIVWLTWRTAESDQVPLMEYEDDDSVTILVREAIKRAHVADVGSLELESFGLENVPDTIRFPELSDILPAICTLNLSKNDIAHVKGSMFSPMVSLEQLYLQDNALVDLNFESDDSLSLLRVLDISRNATLKRCPDIHNLSSLRVFRADENGWTGQIVEDALFHFRFKPNHLEELSLKGNRIDEIDWTRVDVFETLKWLDLSGNGMKALNLPGSNDSASMCLNLRRLYISSNQLTKLPSFASLPRLTVLRASKNQIGALSSDIGKCERLQWCALDHNMLTSLPASLSQCSLLKVLSVGNNLLEGVPFDLRYLVKLQHLDLRYNRLHALFSDLGMGRWAELETLILSHNAIERLPDGIGYLVCLKELRVDHNAIVELPSDIGGMERLEVLDCSDNKLRDVPQSMAECSHLRIVGLTGNPITAGRLPMPLIARARKGKGKGKRKPLKVLIGVESGGDEAAEGEREVVSNWEGVTVNPDAMEQAQLGNDGSGVQAEADSELLRLLDTHSNANGLKPDVSEEVFGEIRSAWAREMVYPSEQ